MSSSFKLKEDEKLTLWKTGYLYILSVINIASQRGHHNTDQSTVKRISSLTKITQTIYTKV
jgi:hypothetical protein